MTDDAEQYYKAWVAVFSLRPRKIYCFVRGMLTVLGKCNKGDQGQGDT